MIAKPKPNLLFTYIQSSNQNGYFSLGILLRIWKIMTDARKFKNREKVHYNRPTLLLSFQILAAAYPKVQITEFVLSFGNLKDKNLLLLPSHTVGTRLFKYSRNIFGQFPAIALEIYAAAFCIVVFFRAGFSSSISVKYF